MKKKTENFKNKTVGFIQKHKSEIKAVTVFALGAATMKYTMDRKEERAWNSAEERFGELGMKDTIVRTKNGKFGVVEPAPEAN